MNPVAWAVYWRADGIVRAGLSYVTAIEPQDLDDEHVSVPLYIMDPTPLINTLLKIQLLASQAATTTPPTATNAAIAELARAALEQA